MVITFILVAIAALLNAVMDSLEEGKFTNSVFKNFNQKFWYKRESWKHARRIFNYPVDAWHIAKSLMLVCLLLATFSISIKFLIAGIIWIVFFNFGYNKLFKKTK